MASSIKVYYYRTNDGRFMRFLSHKNLKAVREQMRHHFQHAKDAPHAPKSAILQAIQ